MGQGTPHNPFRDPMGGQAPYNPYSAPQQPGTGPPQSGSGNGKVIAPAIMFILFSALGMVLAVVGCYVAIFVEPPPIDPNADPFFQELSQGRHGPVAATIQGAFLLLNLFIIFGGIQLLRMRSWTLSLVTAILSMINFGNCICVLGLIPGIWTLVVINLESVKPYFNDQRSRR